MRISNLIMVVCLVAGCGSDSNNNNALMVEDACKNACKPAEMCTVDGQCLSGCLPECGNRVCGGDPICNISCGNCLDSETCNSGQCSAKVDLCNGTCKATELCTLDGKCIANCTPKCENPPTYVHPRKTCGADWICNTSCGTCDSNQFCSGGSQCKDIVYDFVIPTYKESAVTNVVFDLSTIKKLIGTDLGMDFTGITVLPENVGSYKKSFTLRQQVVVNLESWAPDQYGKGGDIRCFLYCDQLTYLFENQEQLQSITFSTLAIKNISGQAFLKNPYNLANGKLYIGNTILDTVILYLTTLPDIQGSNSNNIEIPLTTEIRQATASYCTALNFVIFYEYTMTFDTDITRNFPEGAIKINFVTQYEVKTK